METHPRDRSLFFPILLIGAGLIWLLANFNIIPDLNWAMLWRLWPLALIAGGLDMLFGRNHPLVGALIGLLAVGAAVALLVAGPRLGIVPAAPQVSTERYTEPLGDAGSAEITLDLAEYPTTISALEDSSELVDADITHAGRLTFSATGGANRQVRLNYNSGLNFFMPEFTAPDAEWRIGLSPRVPLLLNVDVGSGAATLDLAGLELSGLNLDGGSGALDITLPASDEFYEAQLDGGSGAQTLAVPVDAAGSLNYDGGSGSLRVTIADTAAVRVEVQDSGSGSVRVPSEWVEVELGDDDEGVWESATFLDSEDRQFVLIIEEVGSGTIVIVNE